MGDKDMRAMMTRMMDAGCMALTRDMRRTKTTRMMDAASRTEKKGLLRCGRTRRRRTSQANRVFVRSIRGMASSSRRCWEAMGGFASGSLYL